MRRTDAMRSILLVPLLIPVLLCTSCSEDDGGDDDATAQTESAEPPAPFAPEEPSLLEPAADEIDVAVTRVADLEFAVESVVTGLTSVVVDGVSLGPMQSGSVDGTLDAETLRLRLGGAMYTTNHTLSLQTPTDDETLTSREITLVLGATAPPRLAAELGPPARLRFSTLFSTGSGRTALLVGMESDGVAATATIIPIDGAATWDESAAIELELPQWTPDEELASTLAVGRVQRNDGAKGERLRAVWRVGPGGDGLRFVDADMGDATFTSSALVELGPDLVGAAEFGRIGRPLILRDTIVAELLLATDVEQPRPGDRTLLTVHLEGTPARGQTPRVSTLVVGADIDRLSPVLDLQETSSSDPLFAARIAEVTPAVFEVDVHSGVLRRRTTAANDRFSPFAETATAPVTIVGAFSSRTLFAPIGGNTPRALVLQFSDRDPDGRQDASPSPEALADLGDPTGPPVGTVLGGAAVFVLPLGADTDAAVFLSTGPQATVDRIPGLRCDEIALSYSQEGNAEERSALACRVGTSVQLGQLRVEPE